MSLKQQILLLVIGPLIILSVVSSLITATYTKDRAILATDTKALCDLATGEYILDLKYPGEWRVDDGFLYKGNVKINNNFEVVDKIADLTGDTVTIFHGEKRVSTTVRDNKGKRAVGTKVSDPVAQKVLKNGQVYLDQANVVGTWYRTAYKPIRDQYGDIIGMFYVGISKKLSNELIDNSLLTIVTTSALLTIAVALGAWYFAQRMIIRPLQQITTGTKEVATGDLTKRVEVSGSKEFDELATAFNQMVEGMQGFATHIAKVKGYEDEGSIPSNLSKIEKEEIKAHNNMSDETKKVDYTEDDLPKGLNEGTLKQIIAFLESEDKAMSAEEIGDGVSLARVTARRYLEYLEKVGRIEVDFKYGTVGRPVKLYKLI